ncbi:MAG: BrnT family toxin [Candidatus Electrothrix sp. GW3-4]|uniref:BrnT family toxin n=1 Tax=Candidatus Electrothrix sp. GW3-4 TaxID=3126740 RepID=UPI0030D2823D|nr:MAG: BrnT family toxin [Candidatus Electrothrix communis]
MIYNFEWNPNKAKKNIRKHKVSFEEASTVFRDPAALTIFDPDHSETEDRWLTVGISRAGKVLLVCHTYKQVDVETAIIRIFSSRKATASEKREYGE